MRGPPHGAKKICAVEHKFFLHNDDINYPRRQIQKYLEKNVKYGNDLFYIPYVPLTH